MTQWIRNRDSIRPVCKNVETSSGLPSCGDLTQTRRLQTFTDCWGGGLRAALDGRADGVDANIGDFAQEALIMIVSTLDSFRGESRFTTWAKKITMNVALTDLKRRRWRDVSVQDLLDRRTATGRGLADPQLTPEQVAFQNMVLATLRRHYRRRTNGQIARGDGSGDTGGNAHRRGSEAHRHQSKRPLQATARCPQEVEVRMEAAGLSPQEVLAAFDEG
jgi:hypothetical protein